MNWCEQCDEEVCRGCRQECECSTHDEHEHAMELSRADFDRDPGPAPQWFVDAVLKVRQ